MSKSNETTPNVPTLRFDKLKDFHRQKLGTLCTIVGGYAFDSKKMIPKGNYQIVKMGNFYAGKLDLSRTPTFLDNPTQSELSALLKKHDIVITLTGTVNKKDYGYTVQINNENNLLLNQRCALIRAKNNIDSNYLLYLLKANEFLSQFYASSVGGTGNQTNVSIKAIEQFIVSIPHLDEQKRIGKFLSDIDKRILVQNKIISKYETLIKGLCDILFTVTEENVLPLKSIASIDKGQQINGLSLAKTGKYYYLNGGITPSGYVDDYNTSENTIAISEGGNSCGFVSYNAQKFWSGGHCYTLKIKNTQCRSKFLFFYLKYREKDIMQLRVGSGLPNIQKKSLENFVVPLPTFEKQCYIECILESITAKKEIETALLGQFQSQKKFLLSKMFI